MSLKVKWSHIILKNMLILMIGKEEILGGFNLPFYRMSTITDAVSKGTGR